MTPDISTRETHASARRGRGSWASYGTALLVLAAAAAAGAWWWLRPAPVAPPMPPDIQDAEVRQAIAAARQAVLDKPRSGDAWGRLGMTLLANLFDREADRCFAEAARLDPDNARWPYARAVIALKRDPENAVPLLRRAAAHADAWPEAGAAVRLQLAEALLARQELDEAEMIFRDELRREPGSPRATFGLGLVAVARGNDRAAEDYLKAVRDSKQEGARKKATAQLAALAGARGDSAAAAAYGKEIATLPDDPPWPDPFLDSVVALQAGHRNWERKVDQLEHAQRYADAADVYLGQIRQHPTARAYVGAGVNLARMKDYDQAVPLLRTGVELDADSAQAHYALALAQYTRAEKELQQSRDFPPAQEWLREAVEHARRAAELKPDHARAFLIWGMALKYGGDPAAAVEPLRKGVACHPEEFDLQLALGETLLEVGQDQEAETHLENARRLDPADPHPAQDLERLRHKKN